LHQIFEKSEKVDAFPHLICDDLSQSIQLLFSFSDFSLPAVFLLQLLFSKFAKVSAWEMAFGVHMT